MIADKHLYVLGSSSSPCMNCTCVGGGRSVTSRVCLVSRLIWSGVCHAVTSSVWELWASPYVTFKRENMWNEQGTAIVHIASLFNHREVILSILNTRSLHLPSMLWSCDEPVDGLGGAAGYTYCADKETMLWCRSSCHALEREAKWMARRVGRAARLCRAAVEASNAPRT